MSLRRNRAAGALLASMLALVFCGSAAAATLQASHQFPGGKGDARDEMVQIIAREVKAANVGLDIEVHPNASLYKPNDQWQAMVDGKLDISSFPLDYASGAEHAFGATLMPGLVRNHDRALRLNNSPFMIGIHEKIEKAGVIVLSNAWLGGAVASRKGCIRTPADVKGLKIRSAGPTFAAMWQSGGASVVTVPSNEVYDALQSGAIDATDTSAGSFVAFHLFDQVRCLTAPGENALWFMYEPVLMSKISFDKLTKQQQQALLAAGKKAEEYFAKASKSLDQEMVEIFKLHKVQVVTLTPAEYAAWITLARESSYADFAKAVPDGKKLIDAALAVQ